MKLFTLFFVLIEVAQLTYSSLNIDYVINITLPSSPCSSEPPNLPSGLQIYKLEYKNWGENMHVTNLWAVIPQTAADVVALATWAVANKYTIHALGKMHNWSPLAVTSTTDCSNILMIDTKQLTQITVFPNGIDNYTFPVVTAGSGVLLENLLTRLELDGYAFTASAAIGQITIGGLFSIGGHGFAIDIGKSPNLKCFGSVVNRIVQVEAVTWDPTLKSYILRKFDRSMYEISGLLTHLGHTFVTSMTLRVENNYYLRCVSHTDIPNSEWFGNPEQSGSLRTMSSFIENSGRATAISFPYLDYSWLIHCSIVDSCPPESRLVQSPYNYAFTKNIPNELNDIIKLIQQGVTALTPTFCNSYFALIKSGLLASDSTDLCGLSKNLLLYAEPETLRYVAASYAVLTKRENIQQILFMVKQKLEQTLENYEDDLIYPMNGPLEIRVTGLDDPNDIGPSAQNSFLAVTTPYQRYPEFDVVVWMEILTMNGTKYSEAFYQEMESYFLLAFNGTIGFSRPEWSKGWAFTDLGAFANYSLGLNEISNRYDKWNEFVCLFNDLDPHNIFGNDFTDAMFALKPNTVC